MTVIDDLPDLIRPHVPPAPPVEALRRRSATRRRHRRVASGAALALVATLAVAGVAATRTPPTEDVRATPGTAAPTTAETAPRTVPPPGVGLVVEPAGPHHPGDVVRLIPDPEVPVGRTVVAAQCPAERIDDDGGVSDDIAGCATASIVTIGDGEITVALVRALRGTDPGTVDCAEAAGRCVLVLDVGGEGGARDRWAPLVLTDDLPVLGDPEARLVTAPGPDGTYADGETVTVALTGFEPGTEASALLCRGDVDPDPQPRYTAALDACQVEAPDVVAAGPDGTATLSVALTAELVARDGRSTSCGGCVVRIGSVHLPAPILIPVEVG